MGGVCSGLARHLGVDPLIVRVAFVAAATAGGLGVAIYALVWVFVPAGDAPARAMRLRTGRGTVEIALGVALLALSVLLTARALGLLFSDVIVWPLTLVAAGAALLWGQTFGGGVGGGGAPPGQPPPPPAPGAAPPPRRAEPPAIARCGGHPAADARRPGRGDLARRAGRRTGDRRRFC